MPLNDFLPAERKTVWTPNVLGGVGVIGGIDKYRAGGSAGRTAVFNVADYGNTIQYAINASTENSVIQLGAGTYGAGVLLGTKRTIRGLGKDVDGNFLSKLDGTSSHGIVLTGGSGGYEWTTPASGNTITLGLTKGSQQITLGGGDTSSFVVGRLARICWSNITDETELEAGATLCISPFGFPDMRAQIVRITGKNDVAKTITFTPGIHHVPQASTVARLNQLGSFVEECGIEDLELIGNLAANQLTVGILFEQAINSWIYNCSVKDTKNYHVEFFRTLNCEMRQCVLAGRLGGTTSGSGFLTEHCGNCLIEDNQILRVVPCTEINFRSTGNVIAYNLFEDTRLWLNGIVGGTSLGTGGAMNMNHGPHNDHNLWEGNCTPNIQTDGFHGSSSEDTLLRNFIHGTVYGSAEQSALISMNRWGWKYSLLGNMIGNPAWPYGLTPYSFGNPNMGNSSFEGDSNIPAGIYPKDWKMTAFLLTKVTDCEGIWRLNSGTMRYQGGENATPGQDQVNSDVGPINILGVNQLGGVKSVPPAEAPDTIYVSSERVWFSFATKNAAGDVQGVWSNPKQLSSLGADPVQHQLQAEFSVNGTTGWHYLWATGDVYMRTRADAGAYSAAIKIAGEASVGGADYVDYRFNNATSADFYLDPFIPSGNAPFGWTDTPTLHSHYWPSQGSTISILAGVKGYQERDLAVEATTILKGNTIMFGPGGAAIPAGESLGGDFLPDSLFRSSKPAYFGALAWPAYGPGKNSPNYTDIPAGARFLAAIPPILNNAVINDPNGLELTLSFSKPVTIGSGGAGGWTCTYPTATLSHLSGDGTSTHKLLFSRSITDLEVGTVSFDGRNNGLEDSNGNDLIAIVARPIYNHSANTGGAVWYGNEAAESDGTYPFMGTGFQLGQQVVIDQPGNLVAARIDVSSFSGNSYSSVMLVADAAGNILTGGGGAITENGNYFRPLLTSVHVNPGTYWIIFAANSNSEPILSIKTGPANSSRFDASRPFVDIGSFPFVPEANGFPFRFIMGVLLVPDVVVGTPAAPTALFALAISNSEIDLTWVRNSNNETGFEILHGQSSGNLSVLTTVAPGSTSFQHTGLLPVSPHFYKVRAVNSAGQSALTAEADATTFSIPGTVWNFPPNPTMDQIHSIGLFSWKFNGTGWRKI